jgi:hypothetical protein
MKVLSFYLFERQNDQVKKVKVDTNVVLSEPICWVRSGHYTFNPMTNHLLGDKIKQEKRDTLKFKVV